MVFLQGARGGRGRGRNNDRLVTVEGGIGKGRGRGGRGRGRGGRQSNAQGGRRGRGRSGRGRGRGGGRSRPKTKEELDAELDQYNLKDAKHAQTHLDDDLDEYFKNKNTKKAETEEAPETQEEEEAT